MKEHINVLATGLTRAGYDLTIAGPACDPRAASLLTSPPSLKMHPLPIPESPFSPALPQSIRSLAHLIRRESYHLVHTHGYAAGLVGRTAAIAAGAIPATRPPLTIVHTVHNFLPAMAPWKSGMAKYSETVLAAKTQGIIAISGQIRQYLVEVGIPLQKIVTIYNGINTEGFNRLNKREARLRLGLEPEAQVIGTTARLIPSKGIDLFLSSLSEINKIRPVYGLIIGDGPERANLLKLAKHLGLADRAHFLGHRSDVPDLLPALDIFVLPSRAEGFGIALLEALYTGLPVLATRTGGIPEIIENGKTGLLFTPDKQAELTGHLMYLLDNPSYRHQLAAAGKIMTEKRFSAEKMVTATIGVYEELRKTRNPRA